MTAAVRSRVAQLLGLDAVAGRVQLGLAVGGLFLSGMAAAGGILIASLGVTAAGNAWDSSPSGEEGAVARAARAVSAVSVSVPVAVIIDDADRLDSGLARALITNLAERYDGQVLVVAAADPGSELLAAVTSQPGYALVGRIHKADADPDMGYSCRADLAGEFLPALPAPAVERIARRTQTLAEVVAICSASRLAELGAGVGQIAAMSAVDLVIDSILERARPSREAAVLAWAGGTLHARQAEQALAVLDAVRQVPDAHIVRSGGLVRLSDPASPRLAEQAAALSPGERSRLAAAVLAEAIKVAADPDADLVQRVAARQAAHHIRGDLDDRSGLSSQQCGLIRGLEKLGDRAAACEVARAALDELAAGRTGSAERVELLKAYLRLAPTRPPQEEDPLVREAVDLAVACGAAFGLEARVWAAVDLLRRTGQREAALSLAGQVAVELESQVRLGPAGDQWRLMLAFHAGQAGHADLSQRLLARMISTGSAGQQEAAQAVLYAIGGPRADTRLQILILEAELTAVPAAAADDHLRLHHTLALDYGSLGAYGQALDHGQQELALGHRLHSPDHPHTLTTRNNIGYWTGRCGDAAQAVRLFTELLPDLVRVLGPSHPDTLATRSNIATWTGECGDAAEALRLYAELLPDQVRVLGPGHRETLSTRSNIATWTGECGDAAEALRLYAELLPDQVRALGPGHPHTLTTRNNIATWTSRCGDAAQALRLLTELLPDQVRVLGPGQPETLTTRNNIAFCAGECGDAAEALRLFTELLPDQVRVLGPGHPETLRTRNNLAMWTGECGDAAEALRLFTELLPDLVRVLGPSHPDTLATRNNIAALTGECGDAAQALRLLTELLPDLVRVLGPGHPDTLATRSNIATWTSRCGDAAQALRLFTELLPDRVRVLGPGHPDTLATRNNIAIWTAECGDAAHALRSPHEA